MLLLSIRFLRFSQNFNIQLLYIPTLIIQFIFPISIYNIQYLEMSYRTKSRSRHKQSRYSKYYQNYYQYKDRSSTSRKYNKKYKKYSQQSYSSSSSPSSSSSSYSSQQKQILSSADKRHRVKHYSFQRKQIIGGKYKVKSLLGDGTFGRVLLCKYDHQLYAVKIIKLVPKYIKSAKTQRNIISELNKIDREDKFGIVRYVQSLDHQGHYCMVFKPLGKSLYQVIRMNKFKGFPLDIVQKFFKQILKSVGFLHDCGFTHTDLKPQNILLQSDEFYQPDLQDLELYSEPKKFQKYFLPNNNKIRIIDFGGATKYNDHHSRTINTRQYRSPQVLLQCRQWNQISDVWSIGCIICQLYTGDLLFPVYDDQEHLAMIQRNSGKFDQSMIDNIPQANKNIRQMFVNGYIDQDKIEHIEDVIGMKIIEDIFPDTPQLVDLIRKCLQINPQNRISCKDALKHPFFSEIL